MTALTLRLVFKMPLRQAEGFLRSVLTLMGGNLEAPDHTTLSRRSQRLGARLDFVPIKGPIHLIDAIEGDIASLTADAAYDTLAIYAAAAARSAEVVVPPIKMATSSRQHNREGEGDRAPPVEEGVGVPSAGRSPW